MNEASRPVAVRVIRPYASEDEYVAKEGNSITKTTIELIGAHSRPLGVILRFEVTLQSGKTLVRGEGRVTQFNERGREGQPSLSLRFTKLDAKSKALVDRAVAMRTPGGGAALPSPPSPPSPSSPSSPEIHPLDPPSTPSSRPSAADDDAPTPQPRQAPTADPDPDGDALTNPPPDVVSAPPPTARPSVLPAAVRAELRRMSDMPPPLPSALPAYDPADAAGVTRDPADEAADEVVTSAASSSPPTSTPQTNPPTSTPQTNGPGKREALLARLRERARALPPNRVAELTKPRPRGVT